MTTAVINEYKQLKAETSELLGSIGESLIDLCQGPPSEEHTEAYVAIDEQIQKFFTAYYDLKNRHELSKLSVAVLALTKSGKSTLINAFLGNELLPVNNVPETARICRITHSSTAECPEPILEFKPLAKRTSSNASSVPGDVLEPATSLASGCSIASSPSQQSAVVVVRGSQQIREHLQQLNRDVRSREYLNSDEQLLEITAPLTVLDGSSGETGSTCDGSTEGDYSGIKLCLLDTPGPNEAGEEGLKNQVERLLDRVDAAIYLLDYTKLKTAEEAAVLERLKSINPSLVARLCSRLFFAVNKMDQAGESCGLDEDETREYVAEMVTRQLNCPNFKLHPDQVLLLSARDALLSRLVLQNHADPDNLKRFSRIAFGAFNAKSSSSSRGSEVMRAAAADMLEGSGVPELEQAVLGFLFEAAAGVKLVAVLDDMGRLLVEVSNVAASCRGALAASASRLAASTQALQSELDVTLNQFDCVMEGTEDLQVEVVDELRAHLGNLRARLFQFICSSLDSEALYSAAAANAAAAAAAEAAELGGSNSRHGRHHRHQRCCRHSRRHRYRTAPGNSSCQASSEGEDCDCEPGLAAAAAAVGGSSPRGWRRLRERFVRLFGSWAGGGCESRDELSSALMDLSEDLMAQVQSEVCEMWSVMECAANARAGRLVDSLNAAIQGLGARLEGVVEEGLQIRLEPVSLRMAAPDACQFHADLTDLIEKGIGAEQARHVRSCERTEMVWEARRGVCRLTPYYVQVPRRRRIVETYTSTNYVLKPDAVAEHFMGVVDAAITATERQLAAYVKEYVRRQVQTARDRVKEYGDRYLDSMGAALDAASRGADARSAALAQVDGYCNTLSQLRCRLAGVQARAERLVPHNTGTGVGIFEQLEYMVDDGDDDDTEEEEEQQQLEEEEEETGQEAVAPELAEMLLAAVTAAAGQVLAADVGSSAASVDESAGVELGEGPADDDVEALPTAPAAMTAPADVSDDSSSSSPRLSMIRASSAGSGSSSCPDLLTAEEVNEAVQAEVTAAAAAAGTLLMSRLPEQPAAVPDADLSAPSGGTLPAPEPADTAASTNEAQPGSVADVFAAGPVDDAATRAPVWSPAAAAADEGAGQDAASDASGDIPCLVEHAWQTVEPAAATADEGHEAEDAMLECMPPLLDAPDEGVDGVTPTVELPSDRSVAAAHETVTRVAAQAAIQRAAERAADVATITLHDIFGGVPVAPVAQAAAAAAADDSLDELDFLIDIDSISGAQLAVDVLPVTAAVAPAAPEVVLPAVTDSTAAAEQYSIRSRANSAVTPATVAPPAPAASAYVTSPTGSAASAAETAVSDSFSVMTAGSNSTGFSGMTAGTGFTLGSINTNGSGFSRTQENLANSVLAGAAAAAEPPPGSSSLYSADGFSYHSAMGMASSAHSAVAPTAGTSSGNAPEQQQSAADEPLDTSLYASIVAHSADDTPTAAAGSSSTPSRAGYEFQRDFAAALRAAGLDGAEGQGPSDSSSDDWCMVDAGHVAEEQQQ